MTRDQIRIARQQLGFGLREKPPVTEVDWQLHLAKVRKTDPKFAEWLEITDAMIASEQQQVKQ